MIGQKAGALQWTIATSYANSRTFGPLDPYIDEAYVLAQPGATDLLCEIACINKAFFLALGRTFSSEKLFHAFLEELSQAGVDYKVMRSEPLRLCGIEPFSAEG